MSLFRVDFDTFAFTTFDLASRVDFCHFVEWMQNVFQVN